MLTKNFVW